MPRYIAIDRALQTRSPMTGQYHNTPNSIVAIFDCRSHKRATAIVFKALETRRLSVQLYSSLSATERAWADQARVLEVPEVDRPTGNPVGKVKTKELLSIKTWVSPEIAERYKSIEHKSAFVADALATAMGINRSKKVTTRKLRDGVSLRARVGTPAVSVELTLPPIR